MPYHARANLLVAAPKDIPLPADNAHHDFRGLVPRQSQQIALVCVRRYQSPVKNNIHPQQRLAYAQDIRYRPRGSAGPYDIHNAVFHIGDHPLPYPPRGVPLIHSGGRLARLHRLRVLRNPEIAVQRRGHPAPAKRLFVNVHHLRVGDAKLAFEKAQRRLPRPSRRQREHRRVHLNPRRYPQRRHRLARPA